MPSEPVFSKFPFKTSMLRVLSDYFPYLVAREIEKQRGGGEKIGAVISDLQSSQSLGTSVPGCYYPHPLGGKVRIRRISLLLKRIFHYYGGYSFTNQTYLTKLYSRHLNHFIETIIFQAYWLHSQFHFRLRKTPGQCKNSGGGTEHNAIGRF